MAIFKKEQSKAKAPLIEEEESKSKKKKQKSEEDEEESYYDSQDTEVMYKEGYLWKKQDKSFISAWDRRYIVLDQDKITFYEDESKKHAGKVIDLSKVNFVGFHYDPTAPVKSKRLSNKEKDESRFDIYTSERIFMMHSDEKSVHDSLEWIGAIEKSAKVFNKENYGKGFTPTSQ